MLGKVSIMYFSLDIGCSTPLFDMLNRCFVAKVAENTIIFHWKKSQNRNIGLPFSGWNEIKKTRKMPNCIMDRFFQKVNEKVNLGRPRIRGPWHRYSKGQIFEKSVQKSVLAAQAFSFTGDKYLTKKFRVVSLIQGMPTGLYLSFYRILSKYFKPFRGYEVHKNLA